MCTMTVCTLMRSQHILTHYGGIGDTVIPGDGLLLGIMTDGITAAGTVLIGMVVIGAVGITRIIVHTIIRITIIITLIMLTGV